MEGSAKDSATDSASDSAASSIGGSRVEARAIRSEAVWTAGFPGLDETTKKDKFVRPSSIRLKFESRFFIALLLGSVIFILASSLGSGWALFLAESIFAAALLSIFLPLLVLNLVTLSVSATEKTDAGDEFPMVLRFSVPAFVRPFMRQLIVQIEAVPNELYWGEQARIDAIYLEEGFETSGRVIALACTGLKRGFRRLPAVSIESSFPFGMVWAKVLIQDPDSQIIVLPRTEALEGTFLFRMRSSSYVPGGNQSSNTGFQSCYARGVREYNRSDSRRHIHWALSARHGHLMVREFEHEGLPTFNLAFDLGAAWKNSEQFELAVSAVASLLGLGHSLGIHPELFILESPLASGESLPGRMVEIDQQLMALARLEFRPNPQRERERGGLALSDSPTLGGRGVFATEPSAFHGRQNAMVLVTIQEEGSGPGTDSAASRTSVVIVRVAADMGISFQPSANNEIIISTLEDIRCL